MRRTLPITLATLLLAAGCDDGPTPETTSRPDTETTPDTNDQSDTAVESETGPTLSPDRYRSVVDLVDLRDAGALERLENVEVYLSDDPAYETDKRLEGWPLRALLEQFADMPEDRDGWVLQFVATDGYRANLPLDEWSPTDGVVAFRDLDAPDGERWSTFELKGADTTPAPFYVVWPGAGDHDRPWAYMLAKIGLARADTLWGDAVPTHDDRLRDGFAVFRDNCMACHSVNRSGGSVGPELNVPMNVTEYWRDGHLADYIRHPTSYRADAEMPAMDAQLSDADMEALLTYLRGMADAKVCDSSTACRDYSATDGG
jgi:mono/diheme cytochrome c family protein